MEIVILILLILSLMINFVFVVACLESDTEYYDALFEKVRNNEELTYREADQLIIFMFLLTCSISWPIFVSYKLYRYTIVSRKIIKQLSDKDKRGSND